MKHPERDLHIACVTWAGYNHARYPKLANLFHCPNEGKHKPQYRNLLKNLGVVPGVPDLLIPAATLLHVGLAIEFKSDKGKLTDKQEEFMKMLVDNGWMCAVVRSLDGFIKVVEEYFK